MCGIMAMYSAGEPLSCVILEEQVPPARPPRSGRTTNVVLWRWAGWAGPYPAQHYRLGHRRSADRQRGRELRIVVNGEFYDFERAQRNLESRGHRLRTRSDSEIALHLYEDFGTACLDQLRGEFAFALWDGPNDTLFAARDRFGIKPLYYTHHRGALYLASEIKALLALGVPARWDRARSSRPTICW